MADVLRSRERLTPVPVVPDPHAAALDPDGAVPGPRDAHTPAHTVPGDVHRDVEAGPSGPTFIWKAYHGASDRGLT